jgi:hypothetical protein
MAPLGLSAVHATLNLRHGVGDRERLDCRQRLGASPACASGGIMRVIVRAPTDGERVALGESLQR